MTIEPQDPVDPAAKQPHWLVTTILLVFVLSFFGGGLLIILNLFFKFLGEAAFAIIALILMAELMILLVAGKAMDVISGLRNAAERKPTPRD